MVERGWEAEGRMVIFSGQISKVGRLMGGLFNPSFLNGLWNCDFGLCKTDTVGYA